MIWINGENFQSAKENGFLYGPFTEALPNFNDYVDAQSEDVTMDFAYPIEGYEAPYGKAQLVLFHDSAVTPEAPKSAEEFLEYFLKLETLRRRGVSPVSNPCSNAIWSIAHIK